MGVGGAGTDRRVQTGIPPPPLPRFTMRLALTATTAILVLTFAAPAVAQAPLPVLHGSARAMRVLDGHSRMDWWVDPASQPDTYHMTFPLVGGAVTFISDRDTLTVTVKPGEYRDFMVKLTDGTQCLTRVSAVPTYPRPRVLSGDSLAVQVIPFTMRDNRIYVQGSINGSPPLTLQLDLGAGGINVSKRSRAKAPITWDASDVLVNSDGRNTVPSSTRNTIRIGALEWTNQRIVQTENMERYEDALFGNALFRDRVVEIDYDRMELRVHAMPPAIPASFTRYALALDGGVRPMVQAELLVDTVRLRDWYLFDTGLTSTLRVSARQNRERQLASRLGAWLGFGSRKMFRARGFRVGGLEMPAGMAVLEIHEDVNQGLVGGGAIGNAWLRRFNVILDNRQGAIWLAPTREVQSVMAGRSR
jgi:hypothetical protein